MAPSTRGRAGLRPVGNLPFELTSFVGRRRELSEVRRLLGNSRLVTLTGIGGVGKTRLALRVAMSAQRAFPDGVWLVELGELRDSDLLADIVLGALGVQPYSSPKPLDALLEYCSDRNLLLVLDNCEHLVNATAALTGSLLKQCAEVKILATSRENLGINGEIALRVPPLTTPDSSRTTTLNGLPQYEAVSLFTERAKAVVPEFMLTEQNQSAVVGICHELDGLPLPIELAAARLRGMTANQLVDRLSDRYRLLTSGGRDAPTRQQTLRLSIDWSHDLCFPDERELWGRLTVFSGGFELDAVEYVCSNGITSTQVLDLITALVEKSILIREESNGAVRYRLLDLLREYGREKLQDTDKYEKLRRRHRDWFEQLSLRASEKWISAEQGKLIDRLAREQLNIFDALEFSLSSPIETRSALRMIAALHRFWLAGGLLTQTSHWMGRALRASEGELSGDRLEILCSFGVIHGIQGDCERAATLVKEAGRIAVRLDDLRSAGIVGWADGYVRMLDGDSSEAVPKLESALALLRSGNDLQLIVGCWDTLGVAYLLSGDIDRAAECHNGVLAITEANDEVIYQAYSLCSLGLASWLRQDVDDATEYFKRSLRILKAPMNSAWCIDALAWIAVAQNNSKHAAVLLGSAAMLWKKMGSPPFGLPEFAPHHEDALSRSRIAIGNSAFEKAFRAGFEMDEVEAIEYALRKNRATHTPATDGAQLTRREQQVAELIAQGLTNRSIARHLVISIRTAQGHVEHVLTKLGFTSRSQIAAWVASHSHEHESGSLPPSGPSHDGH